MRKIKNASIIVLLLLIPNLSWAVELGEYDDLSGNALYCADDHERHMELYGHPPNIYYIIFNRPKLVPKDWQRPDSSEKIYKYLAEFISLEQKVSEYGIYIESYSGTIEYGTKPTEIFIKTYGSYDNQNQGVYSYINEIKINRQTLEYKRGFVFGVCELHKEEENDFDGIVEGFKRVQKEMNAKYLKKEKKKKRDLERNKKL
mgnify:CR=1 FL=1